MTCTHENTVQKGHIYEEGHLVEYLDVCEECDTKVGVWAYGSYEWLCEEDEQDDNR